MKYAIIILIISMGNWCLDVMNSHADDKLSIIESKLILDKSVKEFEFIKGETEAIYIDMTLLRNEIREKRRKR